MIPKRQHMEQTTEGTISYRLSISWSHLSPTSAKPRRGLLEVMMIEDVGAGSKRKEGGRGGGVFRDSWISGPHPWRHVCLRDASYWRVVPFSFTALKADGKKPKEISCFRSASRTQQQVSSNRVRSKATEQLQITPKRE